MKWEIIHIPGKPPSTLDQATVDVLASTIEPKLANVLVRRLNQICPLEDLRHVKRVRRRSLEGNIELSVILCLSNGYDNLMDGLSNDLLQLINVYQLKPFKAKVAQFAAVCKEEWEEQCKLWPTSYHPPNNGLEYIVGFSDEDSQLILNYMNVAIQLTKSSRLVGKVVNAAVIVDPVCGQIIASASDETCQWPLSGSNTEPKVNRYNEPTEALSSSLTDANDLTDINRHFASKLSEDECIPSYTGVSCLHPWGWTAQRPHPENSLATSRSYVTWHPLRHATFVAIEKAAARDRQLFTSSGSSEDGLRDPSNGCSSAKRQRINNSEKEDIMVNAEHVNGLPSESLRPYLCTGFDMYLVWEPCTMCAMALVHQRIRRIFYAFPNPNAGALGSVYRLQGEKSLNHHYSVFRVLLTEKALQEEELNGFDHSTELP